MWHWRNKYSNRNIFIFNKLIVFIFVFLKSLSGPHIMKSATLSTSPYCPLLHSNTAPTQQPIVKVAVNVPSINDLKALEDGLRLLQ